MSPRSKVCFGHVVYVRRSWVTKVRRRSAEGEARGVHGHWTYWAKVRVLGKDRLSMIDQIFFEDLRASGVTQRQDHYHFTRDGMADPPTKTGRAK